jgi:hypothetical protein
MSDDDLDLSDLLNAEYREFIRSLHKDTVAVVTWVDLWWHRELFMQTIRGMDGPVAEDDFKRLFEQWHKEIRPAMMTLINGHPDPDVREAADILDKRLTGAFVIMDRPSDSPMRDEEVEGFSIQLIHDGVTRLRRAVYHAPFRVTRPDPDWDGVPTGNKEGMPGDILKRIEDVGNTTTADNWPL